MSGPRNAGIQGDGFRFYAWPSLSAPPEERVDVLSVTSIRKLCGETFGLVNWQLANIVDAALGTMKQTVIGPRGGVREIRASQGFPSEFAKRYAATKGDQVKTDELRRWLRESADQPRNIAANRGTIVHEAIELGVTPDQIDLAYVESAFGRLSARDRKRTKDGATEEDVAFICACVTQYWDMRKRVPFVILAREPQVWNLTAGYAGSADVLVWFLPVETDEETRARWQKQADAKRITQHMIATIGGHVTLGDWKTSKGVYTDQIVQVHAYLAAEFIGSDGVIDERLTEIILASNEAAIIHIRPDRWAVHLVDFEQPVLYAFLGSVAFARFLAKFPKPAVLFKRDIQSDGYDSEDTNDD